MDGGQSDLNAIRSLATGSSYDRGCLYFQQGRVILQSIGDDFVMARVRGRRMYSVSISRHGGRTSFRCTCPYNRAGYCKHVVAVLLHVYEATGGLGMLEGRAAHAPALPQAPDRGSYGGDGDPDVSDYDDALRYVIRSAYARGRKVSRGAPFARTPRPAMPPTSKCGAMLDRLYDNAKGKNGRITDKNKVRFESIEAMAEGYEERGHPEKAVEVYRKMCEHISGNIGIVNDMKRYYTWRFQRAMRLTAELVRKLRLDRDRRREHLLYFFRGYMREETRRFALAHLEVMYEVLGDDGDAKYCMSLFESQLGRKPAVPAKESRRGRDDVLEAASLLLEKSEDGSLGDFLLRHHMRSKSLCVKYIWYLADTDRGKALRVAKRASRKFGDPEGFGRIRIFLLEQDGDPGLVGMLRDMFAMTHNWGYYEKIKEAADDWDAELGATLDYLKEGGDLHTCIDILLHEKMTDDAARMALESGDLNLLDAYSNEFAGSHRSEYYDAYVKRLPALLKAMESRYDRDDIGMHVKIMRGIPGCATKTRDFLAKLGEKYPQLAEHA